MSVINCWIVVEAALFKAVSVVIFIVYVFAACSVTACLAASIALCAEVMSAASFVVFFPSDLSAASFVDIFPRTVVNLSRILVISFVLLVLIVPIRKSKLLMICFFFSSFIAETLALKSSRASDVLSFSSLFASFVSSRSAATGFLGSLVLVVVGVTEVSFVSVVVVVRVVSDCCWVSHDRFVGWVTLGLGSYASLYDRFLFLTLSFVSLCSTLTGILALTVMQRHPSNIIDFGLLMLH